MIWSMFEPDYHRFCDSTPCEECRERYLEDCIEAKAAGLDRMSIEQTQLYSRRADSGWA